MSNCKKKKKPFVFSLLSTCYKIKFKQLAF